MTLLVLCLPLFCAALVQGSEARQVPSPLIETSRTALWLRAIDTGLVTTGMATHELAEVLRASQPDAGWDDRSRWEAPWTEDDRANARTPSVLHAVDLLGDALAGRPRDTNRRWDLILWADPYDNRVVRYELCSCLFRMQWNPVWQPGSVTIWWPGLEHPIPRLPGDGAEQLLATTNDDVKRAHDEMKMAYWSATTQYERRSIALRAIEDGLIREGVPVLGIDQMFGTSCERERSSEREGVCRVEFLPYHQVPEPKSRVDQRAWYLRVLYDARGRVACYSLSYLHPKH